VSSRTEAKPLRDGSSSLWWFWPLLIIYTCALGHPPACRAGAEGEGKVKSTKWPSKLRIQIWIIVILVFVIWIVLQNPARWI
jgi:4-amino-4-deoxy-L-arabinose transferase-like glycosyltransferase